jgi:hypothetical protein
MPDLVDERQSLAIQRVFDGDDHRPILPTINFSEVKGLRAGYLHQIAGIQAYFGSNGREIDLQQMTVETAKHRRVGITIRQESDRNMLILLVRHVCYSVSRTANLKELSVCLMLGGIRFSGSAHENTSPLAQTVNPGTQRDKYHFPSGPGLLGRRDVIYISALETTVISLHFGARVFPARLLWTVVPFRWVWRLADASGERAMDSAANGEITIRQTIDRAAPDSRVPPALPAVSPPRSLRDSRCGSRICRIVW